jgi:hypothetical protein
MVDHERGDLTWGLFIPQMPICRTRQSRAALIPGKSIASLISESGLPGSFSINAALVELLAKALMSASGT